MIGALFRLAVNEGSIFVDDLDINNLGLHDLRSKLSIIPQEPVLFSGTMRKNLDPFDEYPDHALWNALDEVMIIFYIFLYQNNYYIYIDYACSYNPHVNLYTVIKG